MAFEAVDAKTVKQNPFLLIVECLLRRKALSPAGGSKDLDLHSLTTSAGDPMQAELPRWAAQRIESEREV